MLLPLLALLAAALVGLAVGLVVTAPAVEQAAPAAVPPSPGAGAGPAPASPYVVACATQLCQNGRPLQLVGTNAFSVATSREHNFGCGPQTDDLGALFASLPRGSLVRFWAFQGLARNPASGAYDFTGIDRVFTAAQRLDIRLLPVLSNQSGVCDDGHWRDDGWYSGGYLSSYDDAGAGRAPAPFWDYLSAVVPRYAGSPALAGWELVNEPEAARCTPPAGGAACYAALSCPEGATAALRGFFDRVGARTRALDGGRHLLVMGVIGTGQCGANGEQYADLLASPGLDVATYHDYGAPDDPLPIGLEERLQLSRRVGKPLLVEETGITGGDGPGCRPGRQRALLLEAKANAARRAGAVGLLPWTLQPVEQGCGFDFGPLEMLRRGTVALTDPVPAPARVRSTFGPGSPR